MTIVKGDKVKSIHTIIPYKGVVVKTDFAFTEIEATTNGISSVFRVPTRFLIKEDRRYRKKKYGSEYIFR